MAQFYQQGPGQPPLQQQQMFNGQMPFQQGFPNNQQPVPDLSQMPKQRLQLKLENSERGFYSAMHTQADPHATNKLKGREAAEFFRRSGYYRAARATPSSRISLISR